MRRLVAFFFVVCAGVPGFYCYQQASNFDQHSNVGHLISALGALILTIVFIWAGVVVLLHRIN